MLPVAIPATTCSPKSSGASQGGAARTIALVAKIGPPHALVLGQPRAAVSDDHPPGLQDIPVVGDGESRDGILLDKEHRHALFPAYVADDGEDIANKNWGESQRRLVE